MKCCRTLLLPWLCAMALCPPVARAAGLITALSAAPNPAAVNQDVVLTVKGTSGGCGDLAIDFGDGQSATLSNVSFNNNTNTSAPPHRYGAAKTYAARATPGRGCTGTATVSVVVGGGGGRGSIAGALGSVSALKAESRLAASHAPDLRSVFPFSVIRPGGAVIVQGARFGSAPGALILRLDSGQETSLGQLTWADNAVSGTIDTNLSGVLDQPATLRVVHQNGAESNWLPVSFTAAREVKMISFPDFQCSTEDKGGFDQCNSHFGDLAPFSLFGAHRCTGIFDVYSGCWASGVDSFWTTLANGWQVHSTVLAGTESGSRPGRVQAPPTVHQSGPGPVKITVWWDTGESSIQYYYQVYVEGPAGTAYK